MNKKEFRWIEKSQKTFFRMKEVISTCTVLALIDFTQSFVLKCDASGEGIGEVMMQKKHFI
jgi:hypothetical protein